MIKYLLIGAMIGAVIGYAIAAIMHIASRND